MVNYKFPKHFYYDKLIYLPLNENILFLNFIRVMKLHESKKEKVLSK